MKQKETKKPVVSTDSNKIVINPPEKTERERHAVVNERFEQATQIDKKVGMVLQAKASRADIPEQVIRQVYVRGLNEFAQIDELNRDTLHSYHTKADKDVEKAHRVLGPQIKAGDAKSANKTGHRIDKRLRGIDRAVDRLNKEQYAMNRVNSFIAGGAALSEDVDLIPVMEKVGMKGTGGAMRPHIRREKSPYNGKTIFYVVDAKGNTKFSTSDEMAAKKHLAAKYNSYMAEEVNLTEEPDHAKQIAKLKDAVKKMKKDMMAALQDHKNEMKEKETEQMPTDVDHQAAMTHFATQHRHAAINGDKKAAAEYAGHYHNYSAALSKLYNKNLKTMMKGQPAKAKAK
jgi:hypothetical protein